MTVLLFQSCSKKENKIEMKHEILNIILKNRLTLEKKNFIYKSKEDTIQDSIRIGKIELVEKSYTNMIIDTTDNFLMIFDHVFPTKKEYPFQVPVDTLLNTIRNLKATTWQNDKISLKVPIVRNYSENSFSLLDSVFLKTSYLVVSEPLFVGENKIIVSAKLLNYKYSLDKLYEMEKVKGEWKITHSETMISKEIEEKKRIRKEPNIGNYKHVKTTYLIFVGYSSKL
jgi:hypothetical protein